MPRVCSGDCKFNWQLWLTITVQCHSPLRMTVRNSEILFNLMISGTTLHFMYFFLFLLVLCNYLWLYLNSFFFISILNHVSLVVSGGRACLFLYAFFVSSYRNFFLMLLPDFWKNYHVIMLLLSICLFDFCLLRQDFFSFRNKFDLHSGAFKQSSHLL